MARSSRRHRPRHLLRWLGVAVVCAIGIAYVQPMRAYFDVREDVNGHRAERAALLRQQGVLRSQLEYTETEAFLEREARRLGLVRPGERLFILQDPDLAGR